MSDFYFLCLKSSKVLRDNIVYMVIKKVYSLCTRIIPNLLNHPKARFLTPEATRSWSFLEATRQLFFGYLNNKYKSEIIMITPLLYFYLLTLKIFVFSIYSM